MPREITSPDSWSIRKLIAALEAGERGDQNAMNVIKIPQFQRNIMWNEKKQAALIDSIHKGFPIGALMLYQKSGGDDAKEFQLVDGLQRAFSIWQYKRKPLLFFGLNRVGEELSRIVESINIATGGSYTIMDINPVMEDWKQETKTTDMNDGFDAFNLMRKLSSIFGISEASDPLYQPVLDFLSSVKEKVNIDDQEIPIIVYEGDPRHLPDIFERINTGSVQLSKYQILAAQWVDVSVKTQNIEVIQSIQRKHQALEEKGFTIDIWDDSRTDSEFSLYEYLFGMGKVISQRYHLLFQEKAAHEEESIAFALATVVNQLPISKMSSIDTKFREELGSLRLDDFFDACADAAEFVEEVLRPYIALKLNSRKQSYPHSANQIISMIGRVVISKYNINDYSIMPSWHHDKERLEKALPQHYLADLLQQNWKGSGDSRLFSMVWKPTADESYAPSSHFLTEFDSARFSNIIDNWFEPQIEKSEYKRSSESSAAKVFLKYLYSPQVSFRDNFENKYEIEHLFPVSRLASHISENNEDGWPINCISNLALFLESTNREKSNKTLLEYKNALTMPQRLELDRKLENMLFCEVSDVQIGDDFSKSLYMEFLRKRFGSMKLKVISNLSLEDRQTDHEINPVVENELYIGEQHTFPEENVSIDEIPDVVVSPTPTFFTFGFNVPTESQRPFITHFGLSEQKLRVPIVIEINGEMFESRLRVQFQPKRTVLQFNFLIGARKQISRILSQSYLDVQNGQLSSETVRLSHAGDDRFVLEKLED